MVVPRIHRMQLVVLPNIGRDLWGGTQMNDAEQ